VICVPATVCNVVRKQFRDVCTGYSTKCGKEIVKVQGLAMRRVHGSGLRGQSVMAAFYIPAADSVFEPSDVLGEGVGIFRLDDFHALEFVGVQEFRVQECRVQGSGFRVQGSGFRVQGSGFRVQGVGVP